MVSSHQETNYVCVSPFEVKRMTAAELSKVKLSGEEPGCMCKVLSG
jgi:hypothetical protein